MLGAWRRQPTLKYFIEIPAHDLQGPGDGFDINSAECDHRAFSFKVSNRQDALGYHVHLHQVSFLPHATAPGRRVPATTATFSHHSIRLYTGRRTSSTRRHWATAQERIFNLSWVLLELDFEDTQHPQGAAQNAESVDHIRESVWCGVVIDIFRHSNTCLSSNDLVYLVTIFL